MNAAIRIMLVLLLLLGSVAWATIVAFGLAFCEAYNCDMSVAARIQLLLLVQLIAIGGLIWTLARNRPHILRNAAIWTAIALVAAVPMFLPWK